MHGDERDLPKSAPVIDCAAYADGRRIADLTVDQLHGTLATPGQFVWLGLYEPDLALLRRLQAQLGFHELAVEDAVNAHQRPKLELYGELLFVVLRTAQREKGSLEFAETHLFVGPNYVVTVRHGSLRSHVGLRQRCEARPQSLAQGPGFVLYAIMDFVVDQYLPLVEGLEAEVEDLEGRLFDDEPDVGVTQQVYHLKRDLVALRRALSPLVDICNRLMQFTLPQVPEQTKPYFRDVYDHVIRLNESIDTQRELLSASLEAHMSATAAAQNEHMKRITAWAAMIAVPTMIAGIYGMNFTNMPELRWDYGYYASLAVMAVASLALFLGFRRSGWL
ncbi:MAG: magnesium/cobalt transporter CorA [Vicinamibacterales bacterium]